MALDWSQCPAVESIPGKVSGAWVFRGTRIPVSAVFENLEDGLTIDEITRMFDIFGDDVKFKYSSVTSEREAQKLERAIYDVMKPQFNTNTPPQLKEDTDG